MKSRTCYFLQFSLFASTVRKRIRLKLLNAILTTPVSHVITSQSRKQIILNGHRVGLSVPPDVSCYPALSVHLYLRMFFPLLHACLYVCLHVCLSIYTCVCACVFLSLRKCSLQNWSCYLSFWSAESACVFVRVFVCSCAARVVLRQLMIVRNCP